MRVNSRKQIRNHLRTRLPPATSPDSEAAVVVRRAAGQGGASDFLQLLVSPLRSRYLETDIRGVLAMPSPLNTLNPEY